MAVSISNLSENWTNSSITYEGLRFNANVTTYEANSKLFSVSSNSNTIFSVMPSGYVFTANNFGIGTTTPAEKLDVKGNIRIGSSNSNYIAFYGTAGDGPGDYAHTYIGERLHTAPEGSELLLFKGNDYQSSDFGPDRVRVLASEFKVDTYSNNLQGSFESVGSNTSVSTRFTVKNDGKIGVGTNSPGYKIDVQGINGAGLNLSGNNNVVHSFRMNDASSSAWRAGFTDYYNENGIAVVNTVGSIEPNGSGGYGWDITPAGSRTTDRRARALSLYTENNGIGHSIELRGRSGSGSIYWLAEGGGTGESYGVINHKTTSTSGSWYLGFNYGSTAIGSIYQNGTTGVAYATSSDYRLKENIVPITNASSRVMSLRPSRFNFVSEPNRKIDGFIAHETQEIVPEAVVGTKDQVDSEGNPIYQGIDQSKLVPLLTAALKEALLKIELLENRLNIIENN